MTTIIREVIRCLRNNRRRQQKERLDKAVRKAAELYGEAEATRIMRDYYRDAATKIDPHKDWWAFAETKHKEVEHDNDLDVLYRNANEAAARVEAEQAKLEGMQ
jgi:hypothetical protein